MRQGAMSSHPTSHVLRLALDAGSLLQKAAQAVAWDIDASNGESYVVQADVTDSSAVRVKAVVA